MRDPTTEIFPPIIVIFRTFVTLFLKPLTKVAQSRLMLISSFCALSLKSDHGYPSLYTTFYFYNLLGNLTLFTFPLFLSGDGFFTVVDGNGFMASKQVFIKDIVCPLLGRIGVL